MSYGKNKHGRQENPKDQQGGGRLPLLDIKIKKKNPLLWKQCAVYIWKIRKATSTKVNWTQVPIEVLYIIN